MTKSAYDVHEDITNRIIAAIEQGAGEFQMPWHRAGSTLSPINATTQRAYRGINILSLWISSTSNAFASHEWATFKQWQERGAQVRKGEKGSPIVFYKQIERATEATDATGETRLVPFARASWVFNAAQVDGYDIEASPEHSPASFERLEAVDAAIRATNAVITYGGSQACYHRDSDTISIPHAEDFTGTSTSSPRESFYATQLHELAHWVGAPHRLDRVKGKKFADRAYCFEEIIAELSAAFSCARLGISSTPRADHAQYIEQYLTVLREDKKAIFTAAAAASAATDYILAFSEPKPAKEAAG